MPAPRYFGVEDTQTGKKYKMPWHYPGEPSPNDVGAWVQREEEKAAGGISGWGKTLWDKANTNITDKFPTFNPQTYTDRFADWISRPKMSDQGGSPRVAENLPDNLTFADAMRMSSEKYEPRNDSPEARGFTGGVAQGMGDFAAGLSNPVNIGLTAITAGQGAALKLGLPRVAQGMRSINNLAAGAQIGHGGYRALTANTPEEFISGAGEAALGGLGWRSGAHGSVVENVDAVPGREIGQTGLQTRPYPRVTDMGPSPEIPGPPRLGMGRTLTPEPPPQPGQLGGSQTLGLPPHRPPFFGGPAGGSVSPNMGEVPTRTFQGPPTQGGSTNVFTPLAGRRGFKTKPQVLRPDQQMTEVPPQGNALDVIGQNPYQGPKPPGTELAYKQALERGEIPPNWTIDDFHQAYREGKINPQSPLPDIGGSPSPPKQETLGGTQPLGNIAEPPPVLPPIKTPPPSPLPKATPKPVTQKSDNPWIGTSNKQVFEAVRTGDKGAIKEAGRRGLDISTLTKKKGVKAPVPPEDRPTFDPVAVADEIAEHDKNSAPDLARFKENYLAGKMTKEQYSEQVLKALNRNPELKPRLKEMFTQPKKGEAQSSTGAGLPMQRSANAQTVQERLAGPKGTQQLLADALEKLKSEKGAIFPNRPRRQGFFDWLDEKVRGKKRTPEDEARLARMLAADTPEKMQTFFREEMAEFDRVMSGYQDDIRNAADEAYRTIAEKVSPEEAAKIRLKHPDAFMPPDKTLESSKTKTPIISPQDSRISSLPPERKLDIPSEDIDVGSIEDARIREYLRKEDAVPPEMTDLETHKAESFTKRLQKLFEDETGAVRPEKKELARQRRALPKEGLPPPDSYDAGLIEKQPVEKKPTFTHQGFIDSMKKFLKEEKGEVDLTGLKEKWDQFKEAMKDPKVVAQDLGVSGSRIIEYAGGEKLMQGVDKNRLDTNIIAAKMSQHFDELTDSLNKIEKEDYIDAITHGARPKTQKVRDIKAEYDKIDNVLTRQEELSKSRQFKTQDTKSQEINERVKRIKQAQDFGAKDIDDPSSPISQMIEMTDNPTRVKELLQRYLGKEGGKGSTTGSWNKVNEEMTKFQSWTKLSKFFFNNFANLAAIPLNAGMKASGKAAWEVASQGLEKTAKLARETGALEPVKHDILREAGKASGISGKAHKIYGVEKGEKINRTIAARAGVHVAPKFFDNLKKNPTSKFHRKQAEWLFLEDADTLLKQDRLTERQINRAGGRMSQETQGLASSIDLPPKWTADPGYSSAVLYKRYAFASSKNIKNAILRNPKKALPIFFGLFPIFGEAIGDINALFKAGGRKIQSAAMGDEDEQPLSKEILDALAERGDIPSVQAAQDWLEDPLNGEKANKLFRRYINDMSQAWAFGLVGDLMTTQRGDLQRNLLGPNIGDISDLKDAATQGKPMRDLTAMGLRAVPLFGLGMSQRYREIETKRARGGRPSRPREEIEARPPRP